MRSTLLQVVACCEAEALADGGAAEVGVARGECGGEGFEGGFFD